MTTVDDGSSGFSLSLMSLSMASLVLHSFLSPMLCAALLFSTAYAQSTTRVSMDSAGVQGDLKSYDPNISADGRYVAFPSQARNLVPGDTNGCEDIFVHDRQAGTTERVSVNSAGSQGNGESDWLPSISADGRYVAFRSYASNLVPGDTNGAGDIFLHDRQAGTTECVSVDSTGVQGNSSSWLPSISADGRYVAFSSDASNLASGDTNGQTDVFVHDRQSGLTERVSVNSAGGQGNKFSDYSSISADGRYVAFRSYASNLVLGDTNGEHDVFVHDRQSGTTERVSVDSAGGQGNGSSGDLLPRITADGRFVAFESSASNLVPGDTNGETDIFVHDRQTGMTERVSVDSLGSEGDNYSYWPSISADGRFVAFVSYASNLVPGDTNGDHDIFLRDRQAGLTERVSVNSAGGQGNYDSYSPSISTDGRFVAFESLAGNLVPGDTNGCKDVIVHDREAGSTLVGAGACPGTMTFTAYGLPAGTTVLFIWGTPGMFIIPPGRPCAGTVLELVPSLRPPPGYRPAVANATGVASVTGMVPASACGQLLVQVLDVASCLTSNTAPL